MKRYILILVMLVSTFAYGQESRSTLTGHVTDPLGVAVLHVQVVATNMDTGAKTTTFTTSSGDYTVPFLAPGRYEVTATYAGFKTYIHSGITLQSEQTATENITLAIGKVDESITVHGDAPLVDMATVNLSQELTAQEAAELPSWGRSPLGFAHMEYGAVAKGKHSMVEVRPFDNGTASDFAVGGGSSQSNELLLNGVPNMEDGSRYSAFSPELDAVNAVHVDEFSANTDLGDTAGGIVNITTKGGTNQFHGSASEYYDGSRPFQAQQYGFGAVPTSNATSLHYNQFGGTIGGPIIIPHVIHGRDKLFFFYAFEGYIGKSPATTITSVPTDAEKQGDFSALYLLGGGTNTNNPYLLYNPYGAAVAGSVVTRTPIPNNCLTNTTTYCATNGNAGLTLSPIAKAYMALMPEPNYNGPSTGANGENNYFIDDPSSNNYKSNQARLDWNVSNSNKFYVEAHRSRYYTLGSDIFQNVLTGTTSTNIMWGGSLDDVHTFSPSTTLETRLGFSRYESYGGPKSLGVSPTTFGFPGYIASDSTAQALPYITFTDASPIPSLSGNPTATENYDNIQLFSSLTKTWGRHTIKGGVDIRSSKEGYLNPSAANGQFAFAYANNDYVTASNQSSGTKQTFGSAFALFDLGLPTSGTYAVNVGDTYSNWYMAGFLQDDWKVKPNLSVSIGLRVEHETPDVEGQNHIVAGWNPNTVNTATTLSELNYATTYATLASNPAYAILPATISPTGGAVYAGLGNRSPYHTANAYLSPRIGFSYTPGFWQGSFTVRGGFAVYVNPFGMGNFGQLYGYSQTSTMLTSMPSCTASNCAPANPSTDPMLSDPFPTASSVSTTGASANPILEPFGNLMGINTQLGAGMTFYDPNVRVPYAEKWTLDLQKQFGKSWLFEVGYVGGHQVHNSFTNTISSAPMYSYLSPTTNATAATAVQTEMTKTLTNPFKGLFPAYPNGSGANTTGFNTGSTITVANAISEYPEYSSVVEGLVPAVTQNFNALLAKVQKRMSGGLDFFFNYQWSRQLGKVNPLSGNTGGPLWYGETTSDFPQHGSLALTYEFPFGRGKPFLGNTNRIMDEAVGGWKITGIYEFLSGTPDSWGNVNYNGNWSFNNRPHESVVQSFNTTQFDTQNDAADQPGSYNLRTFPQYLLRTDPTKNTALSMLKNFTIWQRVVFQPRFDAFNVFNRHQLNTPNLTPTSSAFGKISTQINTGRNMQVGVHILF
jgi:hypothetical protein